MPNGACYSLASVQGPSSLQSISQAAVCTLTTMVTVSPFSLPFHAQELHAVKWFASAHLLVHVGAFLSPPRLSLLWAWPREEVNSLINPHRAERQLVVLESSRS